MMSSKKVDSRGDTTETETETQDPSPSPQELKEDVHALLQLTKQRAKMLADAYSIMSSRQVFEPSSMYPDLCRFAPRNSRDCEVQAFNTSFLPPLWCMTAESIATWLLESATFPLINRRSVAIYLSGEANSAPATLEALADKICQKNAGVSLTEALKDHLSTTGCIDLLLHPTAPAFEAGAQVRTLLLAFARARMLHSKSPFADSADSDDATASVSSPASLASLSLSPSKSKLVSLKNPSNPPQTEFALHVQQLASVAAAVLSLARATCLERQSPDEICSDYLAALKVAASGGRGARGRGGPSPLLPAELAALQTEPFLGSPLAPLPHVSQQPSHLFCDLYRQGWGRYRFTRDSPSVAGYLVLCADALYIFNADISSAHHADADAAISTHITPMGNRFPSMALPLQQCNIKLDGDRGCIELTSWEGCDLAVLIFGLGSEAKAADSPKPSKSDKKADKAAAAAAGKANGADDEMWVVQRVDYHGCVLLQISPPATGGPASEPRALHDWLDGLEQQAAECRDASRDA